MEYEYNEEDFLQLSGLQHFLFCRRQWGLIHIENQWAENLRTTEGMLLHKNVHDAAFHERRRDVIRINAMKIHSYRLGLSGECDVVEFHQDENGIDIPDKKGKWTLYPIEYKRGKKKADFSDEAQLCAQAICLEEMFCCKILEGALYYGGPRRRERISFTDELRTIVEDSVYEMHNLYQKGHTPKIKKRKGCNCCSLKDICLPKLEKRQMLEDYLQSAI